MSLSTAERSFLLALARDSIESRVRQRALPEVDLANLPHSLSRDGASFVTLTKGGILRGCIGSLEARRPLAIDVQENAIGAALHDPRFPPVSPRELSMLRVEVSVLSPPVAFAYDGPADLIAKLRPRVDGVVIERGWQRATFLPQVWEKLPDPHEFLQHLCLKAGLSADAYRRPGLDVCTYQVDKFEEE